MISFPNCKINLGLAVTGKRPDGYHNIESVLYPVDWCDALEIIEHPEGKAFELGFSGLPVPGSAADNIVRKAWELLRETHSLPPVLVHLRKNIPMGAGLGGGSSDAAFFLKLMNTKFSLRITESELTKLAGKLGSDCAFFLKNTPSLASEKGDRLDPVQLSLDNYYILIIYPGINSNTREAYSKVNPKEPEQKPGDIVSLPLEKWKTSLVNDFEISLFTVYPLLARIKDHLYKEGALYASMSGSGSAVYGIFATEPDTDSFSGNVYHLQKPAGRIL